MVKFRWTRELIAERKQALKPVKLPGDDDAEGYETMAQYWARMRRKRAARSREAKRVAGQVDGLPRPMKPPRKPVLE